MAITAISAEQFYMNFDYEIPILLPQLQNHSTYA